MRGGSEGGRRGVDKQAQPIRDIDGLFQFLFFGNAVFMINCENPFEGKLHSFNLQILKYLWLMVAGLLKDVFK